VNQIVLIIVFTFVCILIMADHMCIDCNVCRMMTPVCSFPHCKLHFILFYWGTVFSMLSILVIQRPRTETSTTFLSPTKSVTCKGMRCCGDNYHIYTCADSSLMLCFFSRVLYFYVVYFCRLKHSLINPIL
jgi:hypothetical protein